MTTRRHFSLTENAQHTGALGIIAAGVLALMLGGLTACGQGDRQDQRAQQQDQMQGQTGQQGQGGQQQGRKQDRR